MEADYSISYIPTAEMLADFNVFVSRATADGRRRIKKFRVLTLLRIIILAAASVVITGFMLRNGYFSPLLLAELAAMVVMIVIIAVNGSYEKRVRKMVMKRVKADPSLLVKGQVSFFADRFEMTRENGSSVCLYAGVIGCTVTEKAVYILTTPVSGCVISAESLGERYGGFCDYIKNKLPGNIFV